MFSFIPENMDLLIEILKVSGILIWVYFGFAALYVLFFSLASLFYREKKMKPAKSYRKVAVLIPGYKEDAVIVDVARDALKQQYPSHRFDVVIIADSFRSDTLEKLRTLPLKLIEVQFEQSTKSKALNRAMSLLPDDYDIALILDADNVMESDFLLKINQAFENGFEIVQGHRVAKNMNTPFAVLDAISEEINNSIFRKGHRAVGLSSALIGSGMAFGYKMFRKRMSEIHAIGGFDKELELTLLRDGKKIGFLNNALVYDEKVQKAEVFENQRRRWLSAQFIYFGRFFADGLKHFFLKGKVDFPDKVYQMITVPRVLLLGISIIMTAMCGIALWLFPDAPYAGTQFLLWVITFIMVALAFFVSVPRSFYNKGTLNALRVLPKAFLTMLGSLFKLKGANKKFIHTQHGTN
jgi:cellulose synthase/poly-beta-1,6-N-acetylglucosamine synthase-like glycosyltransferase